MNSDIRKDEIATEAYLLYLNRGCSPGHAMDDWLAAEAALNSKAKAEHASRVSAWEEALPPEPPPDVPEKAETRPKTQRAPNRPAKHR